MIHSQLESILLVKSTPVKIARLANFFSVSEIAIKNAVDDLNKKYTEEKHGFRITINFDSLILSTSGENSKIVQLFLEKKFAENLSQVSLETLSVIAYKGPITRSDLENIRGVNCQYILKNLLQRGLIEKLKLNRSNQDGNEKIESLQNNLLGNNSTVSNNENITANSRIHYQITTKFLNWLGMEKITELPEYERLKALV